MRAIHDNRTFRLIQINDGQGCGFSAERDNAAQSNFAENRLDRRQEVAKLEIRVSELLCPDLESLVDCGAKRAAFSF